VKIFMIFLLGSVHHPIRSQDISVGTVTASGDREIIRFPEVQGLFLFTVVSRSSLERNRHPRHNFPGVKGPGREGDNKPPFHGEVKNA
jgi:hypothetical protein